MHSSSFTVALLSITAAHAASISLLKERDTCSTQYCGKGRQASGKANQHSAPSATTAAACLAFCKSTADCQSVSYQVTSGALGSGSESGQCYWYDNCADISTQWGGPDTTYDKNCPEPAPVCNKIGHPSGGANQIGPITATQSGCLTWCQADPKCQSITYLPQSGQPGSGTESGVCYGFDHVASASAVLGSDSYIVFDKACPAPATCTQTCGQTGRPSGKANEISRQDLVPKSTCASMCKNMPNCQSWTWQPKSFLSLGSCSLYDKCASVATVQGGGDYSISDKTC